jgi:hypothetical protein
MGDLFSIPQVDEEEKRRRQERQDAEERERQERQERMRIYEEHRRSEMMKRMLCDVEDRRLDDYSLPQLKMVCRRFGIKGFSGKRRADVIRLVYHALLPMTSNTPKYIQGDQECSICMNENIRLHGLVPCGHTVACGLCASKMETCPICKREVTQFIPIFMTTTVT